MHPQTLTALQLLARSLELHPKDLEVLMTYGRLPEHLADAIDDHAEQGCSEGEPGAA